MRLNYFSLHDLLLKRACLTCGCNDKTEYFQGQPKFKAKIKKSKDPGIPFCRTNHNYIDGSLGNRGSQPVILIPHNNYKGNKDTFSTEPSFSPDVNLTNLAVQNYSAIENRKRSSSADGLREPRRISGSSEAFMDLESEHTFARNVMSRLNSLEIISLELLKRLDDYVYINKKDGENVKLLQQEISVLQQKLIETASTSTNRIKIVENEIQKHLLELSPDNQKPESDSGQDSLDTIYIELSSALNSTVAIQQGTVDTALTSNIRRETSKLVEKVDKLKLLLQEILTSSKVNPIYDLLFKLIEFYANLLRSEMNEGGPAGDQQGKNTKQDQMECLIREESLIESLLIIHEADQFALKLLLLFQKRGIIAATAVPDIQAQKQNNIGTKVLPDRLDTRSRIALHSALFKATQKHVNGKIISFFEETNAYAEQVIANSPLKSPNNNTSTSSSNSKTLRVPLFHRERAFSDDSDRELPSMFSSAEWSEPASYT